MLSSTLFRICVVDPPVMCKGTICLKFPYCTFSTTENVDNLSVTGGKHSCDKDCRTNILR